MMGPRRFTPAAMALLALGACTGDLGAPSERGAAALQAEAADASLVAALDPPGAGIGEAPFTWALPPGFPPPPVPADNPMTHAKVALGRHLFYDVRLSVNQTFACATCHEQTRAFADARPVGLGATGELHTRGSMSLANVAYSPTLTWANPRVTQLERQLNVPLFGTDPVELGMESASQVEARLRDEPRYASLFAAAFPDEPAPITMVNLSRALAAFQRTLISGRSAYDRWLAGERDALSESAQRGYALFNSEQLECFHCHQGFLLSDHVTWQGKAVPSAPFHNTGLHDVDGRGGYPPPNTGVHGVTGKLADMGMFKAPSLRNIAVTAPYMHDGSIATLSDVLDHYAAGGRARSARTDPLMIGFTLTADERADVIAFLESLTDEAFMRDPAFSDPWLTAPSGGMTP